MIVHRRVVGRLAALLLASSSAVAGAQTWTQQQVTLDIPAQPLGAALNTFAQQTGLQIAGLSDDWVGLSAPHVVGTFSVQAALNQLLARTSLNYQLIDAGKIVAIRTKETRPVVRKETTVLMPAESASTIRVADNSAAGAATATGTSDEGLSSDPRADARATTADPIGEVIVTGSHIRGAGSAGSKVITITGEDIERSGHARLQDLFETLPQNFSGSGSEDSNLDSGNYNVNRGTTIDLRGLGGGTTLILINGHRQPAGDLFGAFVDISSIPSSAIERVEILTDGASAVYGSDAIGGVVNFILRKDFTGAETRLRLGSLDGNADEVQLSQLFGANWSGGNVVFGYQYYERDPLQEKDVPYLATRGDQRKYGGDDFRSVYSPGSPSLILDADDLPAYSIPTGQNGASLSVDDLTPLNGELPSNYPVGWEDRWLLSKEKLHTVFFSATQQLSESLELFADGRYAKRDVKTLYGGASGTFYVPDTNPFYINPFGGTDPVTVAYNFHDDGLIIGDDGDTDLHSETIGLVAQLAQWRVTLSGSYGRERNDYLSYNNLNYSAIDEALARTDPATALNLFGQGANNPSVIDEIRTSSLARSQTELWSGGVVADGPLFELFGNDVRLAVGADYRNESFENLRVFDVGTADSSSEGGSQSRSIKSAFAELAVPLIAENNARPGIYRLELSLAGRYEEYSDFGNTSNPKVGLRWQPIEALQLRGTWGTSFKAPRLAQTTTIGNSSNTAFAANWYADPSSPDANPNILINQGPNPDLHEETADVWTAGFDFAPSFIEGLRVSMTYFDIDYRDKIKYPLIPEILLNQEAYASVITRNPSQAQIDAICSQPYFRFGSCENVDLLIEPKLLNVSEAKVKGIDLEIAQTLDTPRGEIGLGLGGSYLLDYDQIVVSGAPTIALVDTVGNPLALRLRGTLSWTLNQWGSSLAVNYAGSYDNPEGTPTTMGALTTVDVNFSYRVRAGAIWSHLDNSRVSLSVVNLFDKMPPFLNTITGYDTANGDVMGRKMNLQFIVEW